MTIFDLNGIVFEIGLSCAALILLMLGAFMPSAKSPRWILLSAAAILMIYGMRFLFIGISGNLVEHAFFENMLVENSFTAIMKGIIGVFSSLVLLASGKYLERTKMPIMEFSVLIMLSVVGIAFMVMARNFLVLYIGLEMQSLSLYVLAAFRRENSRSSEAGLKYFILGALSSALLLFGMALIYGFTGSVQYEWIAQAVATNLNIGMVFGLTFILAALGFKLSLAPFHLWTPDVYQGAPTASVAFISTVSKFGAIMVLMILLTEVFDAAQAQWAQILIVLSALSMIIGAIGGIGQSHIKRLLAYSTVLNMGFVLLSIIPGEGNTAEVVMVYVAIYMLATLGTLTILMAMSRDGRDLHDIQEFSGLASRNPILAFALASFMFSMAGIPPLAGFMGKFVVLATAVLSDVIALSVLAVIASVIAAYYYLRIVYLMYFGEEQPLPMRWDWDMFSSIVLMFALFMVLIILPIVVFLA